jgi:hypothetical protein
MTDDARIPVSILSDPAALPAWLGAGGPAALLSDGPQAGTGFVVAEHFVPRPAHRFGCACCSGRLAAAIALGRLFQARARDPRGWFDRVAVLAASAAALQDVAAALDRDAVTRARFRIG